MGTDRCASHVSVILLGHSSMMICRRSSQGVQSKQSERRATVDAEFNPSAAHRGVTSASSVAQTKTTQVSTSSLRLDVVVEHELPGMRAKADGIHLVQALVIDPGLEQVVGEHPTGLQEVMVGLERGKGLVQ
jgi:hypothetical protein